MNRIARIGIVVVALSLGACASVPEQQRVDHDPWEPFNRTMHSFNDGLDKVTLRPLAKGYQAITPGPVRKGFSNFFQNLTTPRSILNNFLQGKPSRAFSETGRFILNSTVGIGGIFDVAPAGGMDEYPEDFGQTLAVWGVPDGPYVVVPVFGPRTLRGVAAMPFDIVASPLYHYENSSVRDKLRVMRLIDLRYRLLATDKLLEDSKNPYLTLRESFLQNRKYEIFDGEPPEEEDEFFDELFDDEEDY
jgi:phospholipid-binding lipoprotein MlaA